MLGQRVLLALATAGMALVGAAFASPASAAIGRPSVTLTPSSGGAGSTADLGVDIKFTPTGGDSTKDLALELPAGLIANASIDGGTCVHISVPTSACQVGTGTLTATALGLLPVKLPATFDLVSPPRPGDLAGLVVVVNNPLTIKKQQVQLGNAADITLRPASDPAGVGLNIIFRNMPNAFDNLSIALKEINSTFQGLRFPSTCPSTPANLTVVADSYKDRTLQTASAPLTVTGCSGLPYAPAFSVAATRNAADAGVQIVSTVTQTADQATTGKLALALPPAVVAPNAESVLKYNLLCADPASGSCTPIGTALAVSPLYPLPLTGKVYLTGQLLAPAVSIVFPPPFPITLNGSLSLATNTTTFTGIPDIPLTRLQVSLAGGPAAAFMSTCQTPSGTATATLTTQNGDRTASVASAFRVANCVPPTTLVGGTGGSISRPTLHRPAILIGMLKGLAAGRPTLSVTVAAGKGRPKLRTLTVIAPRGLRFVTHRVHGRRRIVGISVIHAGIRSWSLHRGR
ncbi:MAG TPA: hypothetical protein VE127_01685, partial [Solirubrobacteraceae bacterium]|nr:hypothetical protein [Solirubrobacteraceae bacterium]